MNDETPFDDRLRQALRTPAPPADLAERILAQRPPSPPRRWPALAAAALLLLAVGLWPRPPMDGAAFVAHARAEAQLRQRPADAPLAEAALVKRCRIAGRDYLHLRLNLDGAVVDAFLGPPPPDLAPEGRAGERLWRRFEQDLVLVYPPGLDPAPVAERILAHVSPIPRTEVPRT